MNKEHITGAGAGAILGAILAASLHRYHVAGITDAEAALIGAAMVAIGTAVAHAVWNVGLVPLFSRILHGPKQTTQPARAPDPAPPA